MEHVIGWMTVRPGERDAFMAASAGFVAATRSEAGVLFFELLPSAENEDVVVAVEGYESAEAHEGHVKTAHFAAFWEIVQRFVVEGRFENVVAASTRLDVVTPGR